MTLSTRRRQHAGNRRTTAMLRKGRHSSETGASALRSCNGWGSWLDGQQGTACSWKAPSRGAQGCTSSHAATARRATLSAPLRHAATQPRRRESVSAAHPVATSAGGTPPRRPTAAAAVELTAAASGAPRRCRPRAVGLSAPARLRRQPPGGGARSGRPGMTPLRRPRRQRGRGRWCCLQNR